VQRHSLALTTRATGHPATHLCGATINRILSAVSSFYDYLVVTEQYTQVENPILRRYDTALAHVAERHRPFMGYASKQHLIRRAVRAKTIMRVPRPLSDDQVDQLVGSLHRWRDKALLLLMEQGGLRPGEALNLCLEDIQYGRRRVIVRYRDDHPKGVRTKSRRERIVDLYEPEALHALTTYVMQERPRETGSPYVFLVGGNGQRRAEPLGYDALAKMFRRRCERLGIRTDWMTPHALRHTHATRMFERGMRELTLPKRLGHASPESTRIYTRVSDRQVVEEYRRAIGEGASP